MMELNSAALTAASEALWHSKENGDGLCKHEAYACIKAYLDYLNKTTKDEQ